MVLLDFIMLRKSIIPFIFLFSSLIAGIKVPASELVLKDQFWYHGDSNTPFSGIAFIISEETGSLVQQTNYVDGLAWGKYYEW